MGLGFKSVGICITKTNGGSGLLTYCFTNGMLSREERKLRKWRKMIGVGGSDWKHYVRRKPNVVKRRIRKGIPDSLRGVVWQLISGSRDLLLMNPGVYEVFQIQVFISVYCLLTTLC